MSPTPIEPSLGEVMRTEGVPGVSIAVLRPAGEIVTACQGLLRAGRPDAVDGRTLFQACSISKLVTAMAVLRLVDDGVLDLDADVNDRLRAWRVPPEGDWQPRVTIRQLLSHTAGLSTSGFPGYSAGAALPTVVDILTGSPPANTPAVRAEALPGVAFRYSGGGTTVLQLLLEETTGGPVPELLRELVLDPLGMADSHFAQPLPAELAPRAAAGHQPGGVPLAGDWHIYPERCAAGLWTTPSDLCRLLAGVSARMLEPQAPPSPAADRVGGLNALGLGPFLRVDDGVDDGVRWFGHSGANAGYRCLLLGRREDGVDVGAAVMTNGDGGLPVLAAAFEAVARAESWSDYASRPVDRPPHGSSLDAFVGRFRLPHGTVVEVGRQGERLDVVLGPGPPLACWAIDARTAQAEAVDLVLRLREGAMILCQGGTESRGTRLPS